MKFKSSQTLVSIAGLLGANFVGNPDFKITGINEIHVVEFGDIVFVDHQKYYHKALNSKADYIFRFRRCSLPNGQSYSSSKYY